MNSIALSTGRIRCPSTRCRSSRTVLFHKVTDLDDVGMLDLDQEAALRNRGVRGIGVVFVEQAFQDHPTVVQVAITGEIDPAEAAVRDASFDLVLAADPIAFGQSRRI